MTKKNNFRRFPNGITSENPLLRLGLGIAPAVVITTSALNGLGMGIAMTVVLLCANLLISLLRNAIPEKARIPCFLIIICAFAGMVSMCLELFFPTLYASLGIFLSLMVVDGVALSRGIFASEQPPLAALLDGLGMGLGFTLALTVIGMIRELLGSGSLFGAELFTAPISLAAAIPGGFIVCGLVMGVANALLRSKTEQTEKGGDASW